MLGDLQEYKNVCTGPNCEQERFLRVPPQKDYNRQPTSNIVCK